jgi:hypothetical protein
MPETRKIAAILVSDVVGYSRLAGAAAFARLGRPDEARSSVNAGLALDPRFTLERFRLSAESDNPIYLARRERLIDRLREAGVP